MSFASASAAWRRARLEVVKEYRARTVSGTADSRRKTRARRNRNLTSRVIRRTAGEVLGWSDERPGGGAAGGEGGDQAHPGEASAVPPVQGARPSSGSTSAKPAVGPGGSPPAARSPAARKPPPYSPVGAFRRDDRRQRLRPPGGPQGERLEPVAGARAGGPGDDEVDRGRGDAAAVEEAAQRPAERDLAVTPVVRPGGRIEGGAVGEQAAERPGAALFGQRPRSRGPRPRRPRRR